jgi:Family of unknown function (DUF6318)
MIWPVGGNRSWRRSVVGADGLALSRLIGLSLLIGLGVLIGLTGCGGGSGSPASTQSSSPSVPAKTTSASSVNTSIIPTDVPTTGPNLRPGEAPPRAEAAAAQDSATGAVAFARFFIQTIDWGIATTNSAYMAHYFDPGCAQCQQIKAGLDGSAAQGWHFLGGRYSLKSARIGAASTSAPTVVVVSDIGASTTVDRAGAQQSSAPPVANFTTTLDLSWQVTGWTVVSIDPSS